MKYIKSITESVRGPVGERVNTLLSTMCIPHPSGIKGLYRFKASANAKCLTLDFSVNDISALTVIKELKNSMYVKASSDVVFNGYSMSKGKMYKIETQVLDRSSNNGEEYFLQKDLVNLLFDKEDELNLILNSKKNETFRDQQEQGRRPRFSMQNAIIKPKKLIPERTIDLNSGVIY